VVVEVVGTTVAGKYRLLRQLGQGGMGSVWLAEHLTLHSHVAVKLIDAGIVANPEALGRFLREAQSAAALRSPHVVQVLDHGVDNGTPYIAMELLEGESLADRLTRVGRLEPRELARIMTHVARAMTRAHEAGIVHRDLKPDNIFLVQNDDEELAKVLDFGVAKSAAPGSVGASASSSTRTGSVLGTPYYMSPEQAEGAKSLNHRTDVWAMGVIAFECLVGSRPFDAETLGGLLLAICSRSMPIPSRVGPVPAGFDAWFAKVCERDVDQRFATAREAAAQLKRVCEGGLSTSQNSPASVSGSVAARSHGVTPMAQSVAGLSSSQANHAAALPARSRLGIALFGAAVSALAVGGGVFAWLRANAHHAEAAPLSQVASATGSVTVIPSTARSEVSVAPAPDNTQANAAPSQTPVTSASQSVAAPGKRAPAYRPEGAEHHHFAPAAAPAPAPAPAQPVKAAPGAKVNLGI
jgi:eukaryotic-like serine/threonine-protein kinase